MPYENDRETGRRQRQHDVAEDLEEPGAIDRSRLQDFVGQSGVVVAEYESGYGYPVDDMDQDEAGNAPDQIDPLHELNQGYEDALVRDEHPEQEQGEDQVGSAESPLGEDVAVHRSEHRRDQRRRYREQKAVDQVGAEGLVCRPEIGQVEAGRKLPHAGEADLVERLQTGDKHDPDRKQEEGGERAENPQFGGGRAKSAAAQGG